MMTTLVQGIILMAATAVLVAGSTFSYLATGSGEMKYVEGEQAYVFKPDGKERPSLMGATEIWRQLDDHTWQRVVKSSGRWIRTETTRISSDGQTMEIVFEGKRVDGSSFRESSMYRRQSDGEGLVGSWSTAPKNKGEVRVLAAQSQ